MFKLSIGIVSYNRPFELQRTIKSLMPLPEGVEVIICDDKSPRLNDILSSINYLIDNEKIRFIINQTNLGYDQNLFQVIELAYADHVLLLGDDDYLEPGAIDNVLNFIGSENNINCAFLRFGNGFDNNYTRNYGRNIYFNNKTIVNNGSFLFNSILFSGLIFAKKPVLDNKLVLRNYFKSIYIQVAIFSILNIEYGSFFISGPGVIVGGDGESGFGFNESSVGLDMDLKDRSSVISNLSYHKRLFDVINKLSNDIQIDIYSPFINEYKIRSIKAFIVARKLGRKYLIKYLRELNKLKVPGILLFYPIYFLIFIMPFSFLYIPLKFIEEVLTSYRIRKKYK
jgi:glycosyltransferase involved in cell wall biosynthesis